MLTLLAVMNRLGAVRGYRAQQGLGHTFLSAFQHLEAHVAWGRCKDLMDSFCLLLAAHHQSGLRIPKNCKVRLLAPCPYVVTGRRRDWGQSTWWSVFCGKKKIPKPT
mmetsp:Transcript_79371/g.157270  ORF Transcript_79371/g.157270 Transcript_79371/m.157270 type:complete len:107 (-) Transcript_79371:225-545(-)